MLLLRVQYRTIASTSREIFRVSLVKRSFMPSAGGQERFVSLVMRRLFRVSYPPNPIPNLNKQHNSECLGIGLGGFTPLILFLISTSNTINFMSSAGGHERIHIIRRRPRTILSHPSETSNFLSSLVMRRRLGSQPRCGQYTLEG